MDSIVTAHILVEVKIRFRVLESLGESTTQRLIQPLNVLMTGKLPDAREEPLRWNLLPKVRQLSREGQEN